MEKTKQCAPPLYTTDPARLMREIIPPFQKCPVAMLRHSFSHSEWSIQRENKEKRSRSASFSLSFSLSLPCGWSSHRRETKTRDQSSGGGRDGSECPTSPASGMLCVCASERAQPTGAPLLSGAFSRRRVPASPLSPAKVQ